MIADWVEKSGIAVEIPAYAKQTLDEEAKRDGSIVGIEETASVA
jgi:hypothetical protein